MIFNSESVFGHNFHNSCFVFYVISFKCLVYTSFIRYKIKFQFCGTHNSCFISIFKKRLCIACNNETNKKQFLNYLRISLKFILLSFFKFAGNSFQLNSFIYNLRKYSVKYKANMFQNNINDIFCQYDINLKKI